ncbi:MAG: glutamate--tRNA ligase, partial [Alphaproteobacteria bacterium]|nr:glutamate--tRNA ligase [Alphaproteobacteria bacterium]
PPVYDRSGLKITQEQQAKLEAEGRKPHWRFLLADEDVHWNDLVRGPTRFEAKHMSDPVLFRADGIPTYTLSSVEDDGRLGITHVIRGEDHVTNTAVQVQLFKALGHHVPEFAHLALLKTTAGEMSKRVGGFDIRDLRARGVEPLAIASLLARLGTSDPVELRASLEELAAHFEITHFGRAPVVYDEAELWRLNAKYFSHLSFAEVKDRLSAFADEADESFWLAVRGNLEKLSDAALWWSVCRKPLAPVIEDVAFTTEASALLPEGSWTAETWKTWTKTVQEKTGRKGKTLFHPLRLALTGVEHGPELALLLPLIGPERARARLQGRTA